MEWGRFAGVAVACALSVAVVGWLAPSLVVPPLPAFALSYVAVTAQILAFVWAAPRHARVALLAVPSAAVLALLASAPATPMAAALLALALGVGATSLGAALGGRIQSPAHLAAVGLVSAIADLWSVFDPSAPSARLAEQVLAAPEKLSPFALPFPLLGTPLIPAVIGAGDVVFAALYVATFRAHGLAVGRLLVAMAVAFVVGLVALLVALTPIPLLPLLAASVLAVEPATRALERREWRTVLAVCGLLLLAIALRVAR